MRYHQRFSRGWLERLGNGTDLSNRKCSRRSTIWRFTGELFLADEVGSAWLSRALRLIRVNCRPNGKRGAVRRFSTPAQIRRSGLPQRRQTGLQ